MRLIVSTCGTSSLTNKADYELRDSLIRNSNCREEEYTENDLTIVNNRLAQVEKDLSNNSVQEIKVLSAELNGLLSFYEDNITQDKNDQHILIHTDTYQGEKIAELLKSYLNRSGLKNVSKQSFQELNTKSLESFHHGMGELTKWCVEMLPGYRDSKYKIVFNLTGGFKSIQGYMQTIGMLYADEILYIFETTKELLRIPRLPIEIDKATKEYVKNNLSVFRLLSLFGLPQKQCESVKEIFLFTQGGEVILSPWGELVWQKYKKEIYGEALHKPPSDKIILSDKFCKSVEQLPKDQLYHINERLDDLILYIEKKENPTRFKFKKLHGNPPTYQFYAWSDGSANRIFGHYEGNNFVIDTLDKHL